MKSVRWTSQDLQSLPDDGKRYEIIDGELYLSLQPHYNHQQACGNIYGLLWQWNKKTGLGAATFAPGVIFSEDDNVAPDVTWISKARRAIALENDGHFHSAPELVVEVLSPGSTNQNRDREVKRKLYSRRGVSEYWLISCPKRQVEVYRRDTASLALEAVATLYETDNLQSPLLPGFSCLVSEIFEEIV